jgi:two-component system, cell cycle sensor histidine kinase and response regulator CckA
MQAVQPDALIILDAVPEAYARVDSEFRFTFLNHAAERLFGTSRAGLSGRTLWSVCPAGAGTPLEAGFRRAMTERTTVTFDNSCESCGDWHAVTAIPDSNGGLVVRFADDTECKLKDALRQSEEKFSKAFHSNPVPMCIVDVDRNGYFLEINDAFEGITGYRRDEVIGHTSTELGIYCDPRDLLESRRRILTDGSYRNLEIRFRKKNGDVIVGLVSAEPIEINGAFCAISVAIDVTEQRQTESALRESEDLYRQLFEVESDALLLVDQESGQLLAANAAAVRMYGYKREELLSMNRTDISAEPQETVRATRNLQPFIPLRWHKKRDGAVFPVEIAGCYFDMKGKSVFVSAIRDITDRRLMEDALKKSEEKFSRAFQSNPAAIAISDLTTRTYLDVNDTFLELTGYRRDEVVGRTWEDLSIWVDRRSRDESFVELKETGRLRNREFQFRRKNGNSGTGLVCTELIEIDGRSCAITSTIDITERLQLESMLLQSQKLESVGRLAGGVAHDFNNLLTLINGYSDFILKATPPSEPVYLHAQEIQKAGMRAAGLTSQLLAFSRKQVIEPRPLMVNIVVKDAQRMLKRIIGEDIQLTTALDPMLGPVMADPDQIHQVIMNLVVNARDAMPDGGRLKIAAHNIDVEESAAGAHPDAVPGRYVMIAVTDSGTGMDEDTLQKVFEPFFTTKERGSGTGLGLSTAYGIVRQSGGWIEVSSKPGQGSEFRVYLPRIDACAVPDQPASAAPQVMLGSETLLLVEDNQEVRRYAATVLTSCGYRVLEAKDGAAASIIAQEYAGEIDLLLTDVILPGINGRELADRIRLSRPKIKVLFMSGYTADVIARRGVLEQDVAYIPKPVSPHSLASKVRQVLSDDSQSRPAAALAPQTTPANS